MFADVLKWIAILLYYPQYISGYEKVKITTMKQTSMMEMEQTLNQRLVASLFLVPLEISARKTDSSTSRVMEERSLT